MHVRVRTESKRLSFGRYWVLPVKSAGGGVYRGARARPSSHDIASRIQDTALEHRFNAPIDFITHIVLKANTIVRCGI